MRGLAALGVAWWVGLAGAAAADPLADAYAARRLRIAEEADPVAGFKAALTSEAAQERFGLDRPLFGVLRASGQRPSGALLERPPGSRPELELELGFRLARAVDAPLASVDALRELVAEARMVVEVPELAGAPPAPARAEELAAANVGAARFVVGGPIAGCGDPNALEASLLREGNVVASGVGRDALGDQWRALHFLVSAATRAGHVIEPEHWLLTGALGPVTPGLPGRYVARYGSCGRVELELR